jgi:hypothetical protein
VLVGWLDMFWAARGVHLVRVERLVFNAHYHEPELRSTWWHSAVGSFPKRHFCHNRRQISAPPRVG